jgi:hypothetical protein
MFCKVAIADNITISGTRYIGLSDILLLMQHNDGIALDIITVKRVIPQFPIPDPMGFR